jgi:hypothetical protein
MKVMLSDRASKELVSLYEMQGTHTSITHFLNKLISEQYQQSVTNIPSIEDYHEHSPQVKKQA